MKRAIRRHHTARLRNNRRGYYGHDEGWNRPMTPGQLGVVVNTVPNCSCDMCGNPRRRWNKPTRKEKQSLRDFVDQLDEYGVVHSLSRPRRGNDW